jgi:putative inorganic carbon (hco3(-)) transporter
VTQGRPALGTGGRAKGYRSSGVGAAVRSWNAPAAGGADASTRAPQHAGLLRGDLLLLALHLLLVPLVWFPWRWPPLTLLGVALAIAGWAYRWRAARALVDTTALRRPLLCAVAATAVAAIPIGDWERGLPKVLGLVLGAALLALTTNIVISRDRLRWAIVLLACATLAIAAVGALGAVWPAGKFPALDRLYARLPRVIFGLVPNTGHGGIHVNELAGVVLLPMPVLLAQAACAGRRGFALLSSLAAVLAGAVALVMLLATQSRSGMTGGGAALALLAGVAVARAQSTPRVPVVLRRLLLVGYAGSLAGGVWLGWRVFSRWLRSPATGSLESFETRLEVWELALAMVRDFPFTGIGIGQFDRVLKGLYAPVLLWGEYVPHAHNVYLQFAVELGLPGTAAVAWLFLTCLAASLRAARSSDQLFSWTAAGLSAGLLGFGIYGLTDALAPGARPAVVLWGVAGLAAAVGLIANEGAKVARDTTSRTVRE